MPLQIFDRRRMLMLGLMGSALASCSGVATFNALVPYDWNSRITARNLEFGPDPRQRLDIYSPQTQLRELPVVLFIYGGSWNNGSCSDYGFIGHALASNGFVTVIADYRLVPQVKFPAFIDDAALATAWIKSHIAAYGGNPKSVFVMGHSSGAYNAAMVALDLKYARRAGIAGQPFRGLIGLAGPYDFFPFEVKETQEAFGRWPKPNETQPILVANKYVLPALLLAGANDQTVLPRNTRRLSATLRRLGAEVDERIYEGIRHAAILTSIARPLRGHAPVLDDVIRFIRSRAV